MRGRLGAWVLGPVGLMVAAAPAGATTFPVTRTDDPLGGICVAASCSLRQAITAANANPGADTISLLPGTYTLSQGMLTVSDPLTLTGAGPGSTVITGSHQAGPTAPARAGAINSTADLTVMRLSISGNVATTDDPSTESVADGAGAIVQFAGTLALVDTVIAGNQLQTAATDGAGGVMVDGGVLSMVASTITGNSAAGSGTVLAGGADINLPPLGGASSIDSSTVAGNSIGTAVVGLGAGGVLVNGGAANVVNATISANSASPSAATLSAGGVATNGSLTITNSTVAANTGSGAARGNVFVSGTGTHSLRNAIISDGVAPIGSNCAGTFASVGGNIESANQCGLNPALGDQPNTDPLLGPLQDNGGPTLTRAIGPGSAALDRARAAFCPAADQRGLARPQGPGCDVGAFEFGPPVNLASPSLSGTPRVGVTLTCSPGSWRGSPSFIFEWLRSGVPIPITSSAIYKLDRIDQETAVQCRVIAVNSAGAATAVSNALGVAAFPLPGDQRRPSISGTLRGGSRVRCNTGRWSGSPRFSFAWLRDGRSIRHATGSRYKIASRDVGHALQCQVTARNAGGSVVALSSPRVPAKAKPKRRTHRR